MNIKAGAKQHKNKMDLAKEYQAMINSGIAKNQAELARKLGVSRARVCNVMKQLKRN